MMGFQCRKCQESGGKGLNPNLAIAWCFSGFILSYMGDHDGVGPMAGRDRTRHRTHICSFSRRRSSCRICCLASMPKQAASQGNRTQSVVLVPVKGCLAALGHLGQAKEAAGVMTRLLKLEPNFTVRDAIRRSPMSLTADVERYAEGLRKAGLPE